MSGQVYRGRCSQESRGPEPVDVREGPGSVPFRSTTLLDPSTRRSWCHRERGNGNGRFIMRRQRQAGTKTRIPGARVRFLDWRMTISIS
jgi:hypothetical protein